MAKREYILNTIRKVFKKYGFQVLETPAMENLSVLMGKYGDEGDQLLYKILNSGDFLHKKGERIISDANLDKGEKEIAALISEKGLRYDLTVPFARYVASNYSEIPNPFKRYQIQPVWRADRPQRGRYREFYQCDADIVGTDSLLCEAEILLMIEEVFNALGIKNYSILLNSRKLLEQLADFIGVDNKIQFFTILDKLDKMDKESLLDEYRRNGYSEDQILKISELIEISGDNAQVLNKIEHFLSDNPTSDGLKDLKEILNLQASLGGSGYHTKVLPTLARGLGYYTGAIYEVKVHDVQIGSVSGGGRYDNLTGVFGLPNVSGVGFSFGVDRLFDVLEELNAFPENISISTQILIVYFDGSGFKKGLELLQKLRNADIRTELFPEISKLKKQMQYADKKNIPHVIIIGEEELKSNKWQLRDMQSGEQKRLDIEDIIDTFRNV